MSAPRRIVIIGGGVSGLTCARALSIAAKEKNEKLELVLLEASSSFGGIIRTERQDDFVMDRGPDSWVVSKPEVRDLARSLGLQDEIVSTVEANRRVYIAQGGELHAMPEGLMLGIPTQFMPIVKTSLFSLRGKARMALEPLVPTRHFKGDDDESIGAFIERRLGRQVAERLVGPLLGGIFAGDAGTISVRAAFPQLIDAEEKYGSLVKAMRAQKHATIGTTKNASAFATLRGGLGRLIEKLVEDLQARSDVTLKTSAAARTITRQTDGSFVVELESGSFEKANVLIVATPARAAAKVVRSLDTRAGDAIDDVMSTVSSATVFFAFNRSAIHRSLDATGFIVPRSEGEDLLASTWVSSKWNDRAPNDRVLIRGFFGGTGHDDALQRDDDDLATRALLALRKLMPISGAPLFSRVFRFNELSPQLRVGHLVRARALREKIASIENLFLIGNGYDGVGVPTCVKAATETARSIVGT
ncbi:MAG: protoporphyrinogen oxidase [Polyangiaceae bacterium]